VDGCRMVVLKRVRSVGGSVHVEVSRAMSGSGMRSCRRVALVLVVVMAVVGGDRCCRV